TELLPRSRDDGGNTTHRLRWLGLADLFSFFRELVTLIRGPLINKERIECGGTSAIELLIYVAQLFPVDRAGGGQLPATLRASGVSGTAEDRRWFFQCEHKGVACQGSRHSAQTEVLPVSR